MIFSPAAPCSPAEAPKLVMPGKATSHIIMAHMMLAQRRVPHLLIQVPLLFLRLVKCSVPQRQLSLHLLHLHTRTQAIRPLCTLPFSDERARQGPEHLRDQFFFPPSGLHLPLPDDLLATPPPLSPCPPLPDGTGSLTSSKLRVISRRWASISSSFAHSCL
jgi:hypothetical protein